MQNEANIPLELFFCFENIKNFQVLDYAEGGQLMEWNEDDNRFYLRHEYQENFLSENYLRSLFRDIIKGLHYRKNIL